MYEFTDTTEVSVGALLPSEALKLNGEYLENVIDGYRTLHVTGREALSPEIETQETGIKDGAILKNRRYPVRIITVAYQLITTDNSSFRQAFNALARALDVEDAELIFNDEPDKFFRGTPSAIGEVEPGRNSVIGEFEILCADPFKYSVYEYEAQPWAEDPSVIMIDYNGTYKSFPTLVTEFYKEQEVADDGVTTTALTGNGDCGYVGFFNEYEKIIQLGDPAEADAEQAYERSQTLIAQKFQVSTAWGSSGKAPWAINSGPVIPGNVSKAGNVGMSVAAYTQQSAPVATSGTLLNNSMSPNGAPNFFYTVTAKAHSRTANTVRVEATITSRLRYNASYFGYGLGLKASLYIGGAWRSVVVKDATAYWKGTANHTAKIAFTVTGLSAATTSLTGIKFKVERTDNNGDTSAGVISKNCSNLTISAYSSPVASQYYLAPTNYGSVSGKFHGPSMTRNIPADKTGEVGATHCTLTYKQRMSIGDGKGDTAQLGAFQCNLTDVNGNNVAGVRVLKNSAGKTALYQMFINGVKVHELTIDLSYKNKSFGATANSVSTIEKFGNRVIFNIAGVGGGTFFRDEIENVKVSKVTFMFEQYGTTAALSYNGLQEVKFIKSHCETYKDVPNKFSANDVLEADCKSGKIYLNGSPAPNLGALGNDWDSFYLVQGLNQIGIAYSEWVGASYKPSMKLRYREVFL